MDEGCRFLRPDVPVSPRALEYFDRIIAMAPSFAEAYNKKATVLYLLGRYAESVEECKAALQLQPYHFGAASGMGLCYMKLGRYNEAADAFARCLQIHPGLTGTAKLLEVARRNAAEAEAEGGSGQE